MNFSRSSLLLATSLFGLSASRCPAAAFLSSHETCKVSRHHRHPYPRHQRQKVANEHASTTILLRMAARYGPQDAQLPQENANTTNNTNNDKDTKDSSSNNKSKLKRDFTSLLLTIINDDSIDSTTYPSLFTQNIEMILSVLGSESGSSSEGDASLSLLEEIIRDAVRDLVDDQSGSTTTEGDCLDQVSEAVNLILSFVETFVEETASMDDVYKQLLGKIFQSIAPTTGGTTTNTDKSDSTASASASAMENQLDNLLSQESDAFTPGFLRHVEGECDRISSLSTISPESVKMLQILRLIQARVLEELGKGIGEGAIVLGQLLGYDDESERLAVLDAGLAVRGVDFAQELASLTQEALEGFKAVLGEGGGSGNGGVDPDLIKSVEVIDERIRRYIGKMDFQ